MNKKYIKFLKKNFFEISFVVLSLLFSSWLMFSTFSYKAGSMLIATKAWSDFASTIPLIRSFSLGSNFPPQYPLFPGEPIHYHFLFYLIVGLLEKTGIRIDYSLNILSIFGFFSLLIMIYLLAKKLFHSKFVGILSVIFFLFNGSFSFLEFFKTHPISGNLLIDIISNKTFPSFGPYDGKIISAFWNLNIYTNQRHLSLSFAILLFLIYLFYPSPVFKRKLFSIIFSAFLITLLFFINQPSFIIAMLFMVFFVAINIKKNFLLSVPLILGIILFFLYSFPTSLYNVSFKIGFLTPLPLTIKSFLFYWVSNFGLYTILLPISIIILPRKLKLLSIPLFILFVIANVLQLSRDIINNHKFFNFILIIGGIFVSNLMFYVWKGKGLLNKLLFFILIIFLTLSGIIDLMPIKNDAKITLRDTPTNPDIAFILKRTKPNDIILNNTSLYNPASLAGRSIFFGYSYFAWSYGYDTASRKAIYLQIYRSGTKEIACNLLNKNNISYVELNNTPEEFIKPNLELWEKEFTKIYQNPESGIFLYDVKK